MIKKTIVLVFAFALFYSCDKLDELTKFDIDYTTSLTIPSSTILDIPLDVVTPETTTNSESEFDTNDTRSDLIESIKLKELRLDLLSPASGDFDFLNEIEIYISADGLDEILIASRVAIPEDGSRTLNLDVESVELKDYIKKETYRLRTKVLTDKTISKEHQIEIYTNFSVDAEILGV